MLVQLIRLNESSYFKGLDLVAHGSLVLLGRGQGGFKVIEVLVQGFVLGGSLLALCFSGGNGGF